MTRSEDVAARAVVEALVLIALHLRRSRSKEVDIHARRSPITVAGVGAHTVPHGTGKVGI